MAGLGHSQKPVIMSTYPHFLAGDVPVWTRFLESGDWPLDEVWYDVHVGRPVEVVAPGDQLTERISAGVTRKRVDVVARRGVDYWCVEVKPVCGMVAVGQAMVYSRILAEEHGEIESVVPVVICDTVDRDVEDMLDELGVMVIANLPA